MSRVALRRFAASLDPTLADPEKASKIAYDNLRGADGCGSAGRSMEAIEQPTEKKPGVRPA
jgi:hypothetical protein